MDFIFNNPFRVLGLSIDSTEKDKARNIAKAKAFLAGNKAVHFDSDIPLAIEVERSMESIAEASSKIQQDSGRLKHAHLWFWEGNPVDSKAFQLFKSGNIEDGVSLLLRNSNEKEISPRNYSSFRNLGIYYLSNLPSGSSFNKDLAENGLNFLGKFIQSDYFDQYSRVAVGDRYTDKQAIVESLCEIVFEPFKQRVKVGSLDANEFIDWIVDFPAEVQKSAKNSLIAKPNSDLIEEIKKSQTSLDKGHHLGNYAGIKLYENAAPILKRLEVLIGKTDYRYESIAEDVASQLRKCCTAYWEYEIESGESDPGNRCLDLTEKAYSICSFGTLGEGLKKDIKQIKDWIAGASDRKNQEKAKDDIAVIISYIEELRESSNGSDQLARCEYIIGQVEPVLKRIRGLLGQQTELVTKMSSALASHIVGSLIAYTNKYASSSSVYQRVSNAMAKVKEWSLESDVRAHLVKNYNVITANATMASLAENRQSGGGKGCLLAIAAVFVVGFFINIFNTDNSSSSNPRTAIPYNGTALHQAALNDEKWLVESLIEDGANVNAKDDNGETPLDWALELGRQDSAAILRKNGGRATKAFQPSVTYSSSSSSARSQSNKASYSGGTSSRSYAAAQATPRHGKVFKVTGSRIAPFNLKVPYGSSNYYVKLEDWYGGKTKMAFFVRASSSSINIDVPVGTYRLKYASGETWYGEDKLFGQNTAYNQANSKLRFEVIGNQVSGNTVELIKRVSGNLRTSRLSPSNF